VSLILKGEKFECTYFTAADKCLQELQTRRCDLLITDVKMPGKDGVELLIEAKCIVPWLPVLVMTAYGDIPLAVRAIKAGAVNFIEKPLQKQSFLALVQSAIKNSGPTAPLRGKPLTKTERTILRLILQGKSTKEIANILRHSPKTVEVHRRHIMHKLDVDNLVALVKRAASMGLGNTI
jgi:two-component system response regulator FixJ